MMIQEENVPAAEVLSALADGECGSLELDAALAEFGRDETVRERWKTYHLVGELLRSPSSALQVFDPGFEQRFGRRLAFESGHAGEVTTPAHGAELGVSATTHRRDAANDHSFYWKLVAGFASIAAVSAVGWSIVGSFAFVGPEWAFAPSSEQILIATPQGEMVRDARLQQWMEAHRQVGASASQIPSGFLRSAIFESPSGTAGR